MEWTKPHLKITYKTKSMNQLNERWFLESTYYEIKSGKVVLSDTYSGYSVINNL